MTKRRRRIRLDSSPLSLIGQQAGYDTAAKRATAAGISVHTLRHLERGSFMPSDEIVDMLAEAYKRSHEDVERAASLTYQDRLRREMDRARLIS